MTTDYEYPKVAAGGSIYLCFGVKTIAGEYLVPSDVTAITLNIYELLEPTNHVSGYYGLSIPTSAILADPLTVQGKTVNFYHNPAHDGLPMFPKRETLYMIEVVLTDTNGKPSAQTQIVEAI